MNFPDEEEDHENSKNPIEKTYNDNDTNNLSTSKIQHKHFPYKPLNKEKEEKFKTLLLE